MIGRVTLWENIIQNRSMPKGKSGYSAKQKKLAAIAPPRNKITAADLKGLRKNGKKKGSKPVSRKR